jgi:hypothetical protein
MNVNVNLFRRPSMAVCAFLLCLLIMGSAKAQSKEESAAQSPMHMDMPGVIHKQMAKRAGEYTTRAKFKTQPAAAPMESTGTASITVGFDGRFLVEENFGAVFGQPYRGMRVYGYSNGTKQYEATWVYTGSTAILSLSGASSDDGKTVTYTGSITGPSGAKETLRVVVKQVDDDHFTVELYGNGGEGPMLETTYTRKTAAGR